MENDQPENMIAGGQKFKRSQLQDFVDGLSHEIYAKPVDLLKIKHLFYSSLRLKIDFRGALSVMGIKDIPLDTQGLRCIDLGESKLGFISCLYDTQRLIDLIDPQDKIKYSTLITADNLKRATLKTGHLVS